MSQFTGISFITGIILVAYGYLARLLHIYFFWDSKNFRWMSLWLALDGFLFTLAQSRRRQGKKTFWPKLGAWFLLLALILTPFSLFDIKETEAYDEAIEFLKTDSQIKNEMGEIKGFGLFPTGSVTTTSINDAESGDAKIYLTVRGTRKYKDIAIKLTKTPETFWRVVSVE